MNLKKNWLVHDDDSLRQTAPRLKMLPAQSPVCPRKLVPLRRKPWFRQLEQTFYKAVNSSRSWTVAYFACVLGS